METSDAAIGAIQDPTRGQLNWGLLIAMLGCLSVWAAVVFGIVAVL